MRAGPVFSQFDESKAGLSMDLPVFAYSHTKTSFKFLSRQGRYRAAFYVVILALVSFWPLLIVESVARVSQHVPFTHDLLVKQL